MRNRFKQNLRRLSFDTAGSEIAEAAAVLPLLFMVLIGIFWFGQAFRIYGTITRAAQEGARAAAAPVCTTCAAVAATPVTIAYNAISNVLTAANINPANLQPPTSHPSLTVCPGGTAISCNANICVQMGVQLSPNPGGAGVCGVSVTFQYPYHFVLPFTSLSEQIIKIPAAARVRQETQ